MYNSCNTIQRPNTPLLKSNLISTPVRSTSGFNKIMASFIELLLNRQDYWETALHRVTQQHVKSSMMFMYTKELLLRSSQISYHFLCCNSNGFRVFHHSGLIINKCSLGIRRCAFIQLQECGKVMEKVKTS